MMEPLITSGSAFLIGLLGGVHCLGMCGGIVNALSIGGGEKTSGRPQILLLYNLGRIGSYTLAGAMVGGLGLLLQGPVGILGQELRILAGLMMVAMGLYLGGWWRGLAHLERLGNFLVWRRLQPFASRLLPAGRPGPALLLGMLWGWLPCGLVYSTLTLAGALADWRQSAAVMAAFGLGTLPIMLFTGVFAAKVRGWMRRLAVRSGAAILVIIFGFWTLLPPVLHLLGQATHH